MLWILFSQFLALCLLAGASLAAPAVPSPACADHADPGAPGSLAALIAAPGGPPPLIEIPPGAPLSIVSRDLAIPPGVTLRIPPGATIEVASGRTLALSGVILEAGPRQIFSGGGVVSGPPKTGGVYPQWFGARENDPAFDNASAVSRAVDFAAGVKPVRFLAGTYHVKKPLVFSARRYQWEGERGERGANQMAVDPSYPATIIVFSPDNPRAHLVDVQNPDASGKTRFGPFVHENLAFDLRSGAGGFRFGLEDADGDGAPDEPLPAQGLIFGVRFEHCAFQAPFAKRASDASGRIARSGQHLLTLVKCFEAFVSDVSFAGGDTHARFFGCDKPTVQHVRSQGAHLPFLAVRTRGAGLHESGVQHVFDDIQVEGWTFTPILLRNVTASVTDSRFENGYDDAAPGFGRASLTSLCGITARVDPARRETGSGGEAAYAISFTNGGAPCDMTGIVTPHASLLVLESADGLHSLPVYPVSVSGDLVRVDASGTTLTWSDRAARVTRILGFGPLCAPVETEVNVSGISIGTARDTPAFVYVPGIKPMSIANVSAAWGRPHDMRSLVVGNRLFGPRYLNTQMAFANCSPVVAADPDHPLVFVSNWRGGRGGSPFGEWRGKSGGVAEALSTVRRAWTFTPKDAGTSAGGSHAVPFERLPGEPRTAEAVWAWVKGAEPKELLLLDPTLPATPGARLRVTLRARARGEAGALNLRFAGAGGRSDVLAIPLSPRWITWERVMTTPREWADEARTPETPCGFALSGSGWALAGLAVEELPEGDAPWRARTRPREPLAAADSGGRFHTGGAKGPVEFSLPPGAPGLRYDILRAGPGAVRVVPAGREAIRGGGPGKALSLPAGGDRVEIEWVHDRWEVTGGRGTPVFDP